MGHSARLPLWAITIFGVVFPALAAQPAVLPWEREILLREAAQSVTFKNM